VGKEFRWCSCCMTKEMVFVLYLIDGCGGVMSHYWIRRVLENVDDSYLVVDPKIVNIGPAVGPETAFVMFGRYY